MSKAPAMPAIRLRGVRHNNLKNFDLDVPLRRLVVITGLSGSGKSSLAFDTLFAEGQRRYIETFSPYARQFFDRMDKPRVDSIEGIPPAIAIEQRNAVRSTRSTVGTMTEICDYLKVLWPHLAKLHCQKCGKPVERESPQKVWETIASVGRASSRAREAGGSSGASPHQELIITFDLPLSEKLPLAESLALVGKQGYQRLLINGQVARLDEAPSLLTAHHSLLTVVQDRLKPVPANRARFTEACEQAYHFGKGKLGVHEVASGDVSKFKIQNSKLFSNRFHCAECDLDYREPSPALFSFNHPVGACPSCKGFGRTITIDYDLALPDRSLPLAQGAIKPWRTGTGAESQNDLAKFCKKRGVRMDVPFRDLPEDAQRWVIDGDPGYDSNDPANSWPRKWYGIKGYFRWLESKSYKMHVRVLLSRYRAYTSCPTCNGKRFQPESLLYQLNVSPPKTNRSRQSQEQLHPLPAGLEVLGKRRKEFAEGEGPQRTERAGASESLGRGEGERDAVLSLADFYALPIGDALTLVKSIAASRPFAAGDPIQFALDEVQARLGFLAEVGLGYLTLDRPTRTLSGGETERVNLTTCLGTRLVNTLFVLDEPSVGLHSRDTERLVRILERLRNAGNTVVVVEHEASVMRAADQLIDLGPGHGESGGHVVFQGPFKEILKHPDSLTGQYLSGRKRIEVLQRRPVKSAAGSTFLRITNATRHNLRDLSVEIPLGRLVCLTGVSGSGKTTLVREVLLPALETRLKDRTSNLNSPTVKASDRLGEDDSDDSENSALHTPHSALVDGWEKLREVVLVDQSPIGRTPRSNPAVYIGAFDFIREVFADSELAKQRGLNASAFSFNSAQGQCERCRGAGFEKIEMQFLSDVFIRCPDCDGRRYRPHILEVKVQSPKSKVQGRACSIGDLLDATVDEAIEFFGGLAGSRPAQRAVECLKLLQEVGLGYLRLGQPINTLSGGECQRLKLVGHLAEHQTGSAQDTGSTLFLFDEPTTGLHFEDVRILLQVFQRLVDAGHSVLVIEHNLDVIKCADWVIDLGPEAGEGGGHVVVAGTPETVAACKESHTGHALQSVLG